MLTKKKKKIYYFSLLRQGDRRESKTVKYWSSQQIQRKLNKIAQQGWHHYNILGGIFISQEALEQAFIRIKKQEMKSRQKRKPYIKTNLNTSLSFQGTATSIFNRLCYPRKQ